MASKWAMRGGCPNFVLYMEISVVFMGMLPCRFMAIKNLSLGRDTYIVLQASLDTAVTLPEVLGVTMCSCL